MANIQYIGARYVPKFYQNPDTGDMTWKSGVGYEPLTVVKYQDDTYTSKKPVGSGVGNPAANPSYWAKTADFNAALVALQNEVHTLQAEVAGVSGNPKDHKFLFVGDSYGTVTDNIVAPFLNALGIYGAGNYHSVCSGGAGFIDSNSFYDELVNYNYSTPRDEFTDIIVIGGVNDADPNNTPTYSGIQSAIDNFMQYARSEYPNAKVYIGCVGGVTGTGVHANYNANLNTVVLNAYRDCAKFGAQYLTGVENVMNDYYNCFVTDGVHPNSTGAALLGHALAQAWLSGSAKVCRYTNDFTLKTGVSAHSSFIMNTSQEGNIVTFEIGGLLNFPDNLVTISGNTDPIPLFDMFSPYFKGLGSSVNARDCIKTDVQLFTYDGSYHVENTHNASLFIDDTGAGSLYIEEFMSSSIADVGRVYFPRQIISVDLFKHR